MQSQNSLMRRSISEKVDITKFPNSNEVRRQFNGVPSIGDMHGNTMKLIWCLIKEGILEMTKEDFDDLWVLYNRLSNTRDDQDAIIEFAELLQNKVKVNPGTNICLLGDIFADRGCNDYLTLKVFETLGKGGVQPEIIYSNHDNGFWRELFNENFGDRDGSIINYGQSSSLQGLIAYSKSKEGVLDEARKLSMQYVLPSMRLISYTLSPDKKTIGLTMHAPNDFGNIEGIARELGVSYRDKSPVELAETIDIINLKFQETLRTGGRRLFSMVDEHDSCIFKCLWNGANGTPMSYVYGKIDRSSYKPYVSYVSHGHSIVSNPEPDFQYGLDNNLGKGSANNCSEQTVFFDDKTSFVASRDRRNASFAAYEKFKEIALNIDKMFQNLNELNMNVNKYRNGINVWTGDFNVGVKSRIEQAIAIFRQNRQKYASIVQIIMNDIQQNKNFVMEAQQAGITVESLGGKVNELNQKLLQQELNINSISDIEMSAKFEQKFKVIKQYANNIEPFLMDRNKKIENYLSVCSNIEKNVSNGSYDFAKTEQMLMEIDQNLGVIKQEVGSGESAVKKVYDDISKIAEIVITNENKSNLNNLSGLADYLVKLIEYQKNCISNAESKISQIKRKIKENYERFMRFKKWVNSNEQSFSSFSTQVKELQNTCVNHKGVLNESQIRDINSNVEVFKSNLYQYRLLAQNIRKEAGNDASLFGVAKNFLEGIDKFDQKYIDDISNFAMLQQKLQANRVVIIEKKNRVTEQLAKIKADFDSYNYMFENFLSNSRSGKNQDEVISYILNEIKTNEIKLDTCKQLLTDVKSIDGYYGNDTEDLDKNVKELSSKFQNLKKYVFDVKRKLGAIKQVSKYDDDIKKAKSAIKEKELYVKDIEKRIIGIDEKLKNKKNDLSFIKQQFDSANTILNQSKDCIIREKTHPTKFSFWNVLNVLVFIPGLIYNKGKSPWFKRVDLKKCSELERTIKEGEDIIKQCETDTRKLNDEKEDLEKHRLLFVGQVNNIVKEINDEKKTISEQEINRYLLGKNINSSEEQILNESTIVSGYQKSNIH